jgi:hypothetical protein
MNKDLERIRSRIRVLGSLLAWEERSEFFCSNWRSRKEEHDNLLEKLYKLEKRA